MNRTAVFSALFVSALLVASSTPNDVVLRVTPVQTHMSLTVELQTQSTRVQGWSFGLCHDRAKATVINVEPADELNFLLYGGPVGYLTYGIAEGEDSTGVFQGVVVGSIDPGHPTEPIAVGPYPDGFPLLHVRYEIREESQVTLCSTLGRPPVPSCVVVNGQSVYPDSLRGSLLLTPTYEEELTYKVTPSQSDGVVTVSLVSPTVAIQGWSFALCHWKGKAAIVEIANTRDIDVLKGGDPVDFLISSLVDGETRAGVTQAAVIDYSSRAYGPFPQGVELLHVSYAVSSETDLTFCEGTLGSPAVNNLIVIRGDGYSPRSQLGAHLVVGSLAAKFVRGDVSRDGRVDIADAIRICYMATGHGRVSCEDAADVNDNGRVDIADAVSLLSYLFARGRPPATPFPGAGADLTTEDELGCES